VDPQSLADAEAIGKLLNGVSSRRCILCPTRPPLPGTAWLLDHPDDPTGPVWIRLDRRPVRRDQARSVWSRPDRRRAPGCGLAVGVRIPRGAHHQRRSEAVSAHPSADLRLVQTDLVGSSPLWWMIRPRQSQSLPGHRMVGPATCGGHARRHSSQADGVGKRGEMARAAVKTELRFVTAEDRRTQLDEYELM
jgi:hypothetical protein